MRGRKNKRRNSILLPVALASAFLVCGAVVLGVTYWKDYNSVIYCEDGDKMLSHAKQLYDRGNTEKALKQLEFYCASQGKCIDETILLAQWYEENGDIDASVRTYSKATELFDYADDELSVKKSSCYFDENDLTSIKISPVVGRTMNMSLTIGGENITPVGTENGRIDKTLSTLIDTDQYLTTDWFEVDDERESLLLTGGFNCATWQFMDKDGIVTSKEDDTIYNDLSSVAISNQSYAMVAIPEGCCKCRVTYANLKESILDEDILIVYGDKPQGISSKEKEIIQFPDLKENQYITFDGNHWYLFENDVLQNELTLPTDIFESGEAFTLSGDICGKVEMQFGNESKQKLSDRTKQYGIRHAVEDGTTICQRLGDAKGMHFDYSDSDGHAVENDFDYAYPWSDMKLCCITYDGQNVIYEDAPEFCTDGSVGNVMVEIPKFYVKRTVADGTEEIWISGTQYEDYEVDPVFIADGVEKDFVYISAYLGSEQDDCIRSVSNTYPIVRIPYGTLLEEARNNGEGYDEMNFFMYEAVQKLFLVETGCLDTTSLFSGETECYFYYNEEDSSKSGVALQSSKATNSIIVNDSGKTRKLMEGVSVIILDVQDGWESYDYDADIFREIISVEKTDDGNRKITFSGAPVDVVEGSTVVASYPSRTGKTNDLEYCTGIYMENNGKYGFKYRGIENLYGSALVMLSDDAYLNNGNFYFENEVGEVEQLSVMIPEQSKTLNTSENGYDFAGQNCIKTMSYDEEYSSIMIPVETGASSYSFYGDYWYYKSATDGENYYFCVGSADDNRRIGGLFQMRGIISSYSFSGSFHTGRIMYR